MVATRDIKAGEVLLRSMHYTTSVSEDWVRHVCSSCWTPHRAELTVKCDDCAVRCLFRPFPSMPNR